MSSIIKRAGNALKQPSGKLEKPKVLQFPIIDICNSRCQMCYIWKHKEKQPITPELLAGKLSDPLFSEVRAVGINGGEPTLRADLPEIGDALFSALPALQDISLITNAYKTDWVIERTQQLAKVIHRHGGKLDVMVSLDGYGDVHDIVRGKPGNFQRAIEVLDWLQESQVADSIRIGCTIIRDNAFGLHRLLRFCKDRDLYVKYRVGIPHQRLYTENLDEPYHFSLAERLNVINFLDGLERNYEPNLRQRHFYRSLIDQLRDGSPRKAGCDWQHRGATLTSRGELLYCAVESPVLTQIDAPDLSESWFGGQEIVDQIKNEKCDNCRHDYVGIPTRTEQIKIAGKALQEMISHNPEVSALYEGVGLQEMRTKRRFNKKRARLAEMPISASEKPPIAPIIICGWYGTETLGDKAILAAVVDGLRKSMGNHPIVIASLDDQISVLTRSQMAELSDCKILPIDEAISLAPHAQAVVFGGGPIMGIDELLPMARMFELVKENGGQAIIAGCGVGPERASFYTNTIQHILDMADIRIFRDEPSRARAAQLASKCAGDPVTCDPAFSWLKSKTVMANLKEGKTLLLGLRSFPWREYAQDLGARTGLEIQERLDNSICSALTSLISQFPELTILAVPMCTNGYGGDDRWYYQSLLNQAPSLSKHFDWDVMERDLAPDEYRALFASADAALTMRFHSLVFALHAQLPSVALDYTLGRGKVSALAKRTGTKCVSLQTLDAQSLLQDLTAALQSPRIENSYIGEDFVETLANVLEQAKRTERV